MPRSKVLGLCGLRAVPLLLSWGKKPRMLIDRPLLICNMWGRLFSSCYRSWCAWAGVDSWWVRDWMLHRWPRPDFREVYIQNKSIHKIHVTRLGCYPVCWENLKVAVNLFAFCFWRPRPTWQFFLNLSLQLLSLGGSFGANVVVRCT